MEYFQYKVSFHSLRFNLSMIWFNFHLKSGSTSQIYHSPISKDFFFSLIHSIYASGIIRKAHNQLLPFFLTNHLFSVLSQQTQFLHQANLNVNYYQLNLYSHHLILVNQVYVHFHRFPSRQQVILFYVAYINFPSTIRNFPRKRFFYLYFYFVYIIF